MSDEGFLSRWARRKTESRQGIEPVREPAPELAPAPVVVPAPVVDTIPAVTQPAVAEPARLPTMDDVAQLTSESDFSAFVARGVDQAVRRSALKKLFADPHFKALDRLDMYMDDYNIPSPMPEGMLATLKHSKSFFDQAAEDARKRAEAEAAAAAPGDTLAVETAPADEPNDESADEKIDNAANPGHAPVIAPAAHVQAETIIITRTTSIAT